MTLQTDTVFQFQDALDSQTLFTKPVPHSDSLSIISVDTTPSFEAPLRFITSLQNRPAEINPKQVPKSQIAWVMIILIACLLVLAIIRFTGKKILPDLFQSVQSTKPAFQNDSPPGFTILLFLLSVMVYSILIVTVIQEFNILDTVHEGFTFKQFIVIPAIIASLFIIQMLFTRLSGFIFNARGISKKYAANIFALNVIGAIILLPILMISIYDRTLVSIYLALGIISLLFIFRAIKGSFIILDERKYLFYHFFAYFCTLEILPILIIIKAIIIVNQL